MSQARAQSGRHRVVVVGGGFGGLPATRFLARSKVEVTLIDRRNHHLFQPLLYQVATGILSPGRSRPVLRQILRKHGNVQVEMAEVTGFDLERRVVKTVTIPGEEREYPYDSLIVAAGAGQSYFGHDEFALIAPGMKTIDDAFELRRRVYGAFELAESSVDDARRRYWLTMVVVGAGPTGVELAGQLRELATRSLTGNFRTIDPASVRVVLVDGGPNPWRRSGIDSRRGRPRRSPPWASSSSCTRGSWAWTPSASISKVRTARIGSRPARRSGRRGSKRRPWLGCWPRRPGARPTGRAASRCCPT